MYGRTYTRHRRARDVRRATERAARMEDGLGDALDQATLSG